MTRLPDPTPRMTLPRALLSEALRLARSPLTAVHLVCSLAAGLACGEYFSITRWDPALGADAYAQFLGALMPLMSAIVCGLAVDEERAAGRLANLTVVPSRGRAVAAKLLALGLATLMWTVPGGARETGGPYMRDPRHPRHFTDEFKRQIVDLYNAGKPKREIMDEYDLGKSTVERWIKSINATGS
ncbi:helix-turn-helix domain-containing protein, partial [Hominenteromicrobium sp.]|uniref:helix-turn-helix domain-containing protein n=1 Tax=Hominenteromicrobium sp. TaxID=3073581 RepID=UPI003AEFA26A